MFVSMFVNVICRPRRKTLMGAKHQASASWDGTVKVWDLYKNNSTPETFECGADVVCVAFRPDGSQVCSGTIRGLLRFWNVEDGSLVCEIDGQKDIKGGML
jgi:periodic tryptophan protein 2